MKQTNRSFGTLATVAVVLLAGLALVAVASADAGEETEIQSMVFVGQDGHKIEVDLDDGKHAWVMDLDGHGELGAFLGVMLSDTTPELRAHLGAPEGAGVLISKVVTGSAAEQAGLQVGDVVAAVDGETVASARELRQAVHKQEPGTTVALEVWRDGQLMNLTATLKQGPEMHHDGVRKVHKIVRICDGGEDCEGLHLNLHELPKLGDSPCGDAAECEIRVRCEKGTHDCECTINGEAADCTTLHLGHDE